MLIAHVPAGYLVLRLFERFWNKVRFDRKRRIILYLIGIFFAVAPDLDLIYHYFYSAENSHRGYISHGIILYLILWLIFYIVGCVLKSEFFKSLGFVIFLGSLTHLILDMIGSGVALFTPASVFMFSLRNFDFIQESYLGKNIFLFNYSLELFLWILALIVFGFEFIKNKRNKIIACLVGFILFLAGFYGLFYVNSHIYNGDNDNMCFQDTDADKILNSSDDDIDGDGIKNILDSDANGNGIDNREEIVKSANNMIGKWYDESEAGFGEVFSRFGLITNIDVARLAYQSAGIYFENEFRADYEKNPDGYVLTPKDSLFDRQVKNLKNFCEHNRMIVDKDKIKNGDVVFLQNGDVGIVSSNYIDNNVVFNVKVVFAKRGRLVREYSLNELEKEIGKVEKYCQFSFRN